jgi:hypothetical protein
LSNNVQVVESIIEERLGDLEKLHEAFPENTNPFLEAISPEVARFSSLTRSLTSRLGGRLAGIARDLSVQKFGSNSVPSFIVREGLSFEPDKFHKNDTYVWTDFNPDLLLKEAQHLITFAGQGDNKRIGSTLFGSQYDKSLQKLIAAPKVEVWKLQVDLFVDADTLGFCELESGGELDTSNGPAQPTKLVKAGLASGSLRHGLHFCLAYSNRGQNLPIQSALTRYLQMSDQSDTGDGLYVGQIWWEKVLPDGVTYNQFMKCFKQVVDKLDIVG